jgi:hypothetical protein
MQFVDLPEKASPAQFRLDVRPFVDRGEWERSLVLGKWQCASRY